MRDGRDAIDALAGWLRSKYGGSRVLGVGHRVVHGGATSPVRRSSTPKSSGRAARADPARAAASAIQSRGDRSGLRTIARCAASRLLRHQLSSRTVGRSPSWFRCRASFARQASQRYGFHGLSYEYIASVLPEVAPEIADGRVIVAHLGSGASLCALKDGKSVDSTLGFTALDGLCMGTRPGALDPGVVLYLFQNLGLSAKEVETILYKKSGLLGISGISNDMRDLLGERRAGGAPGGRLLRLSRRERDRRAGRGARRRRCARVHRRHRRELAGDPPANLRGVGVAWVSNSTTRRTPRTGRGFRRRAARFRRG